MLMMQHTTPLRHTIHSRAKEPQIVSILFICISYDNTNDCLSLSLRFIVMPVVDYIDTIHSRTKESQIVSIPLFYLNFTNEFCFCTFVQVLRCADMI